MFGSVWCTEFNWFESTVKIASKFDISCSIWTTFGAVTLSKTSAFANHFSHISLDYIQTDLHWYWFVLALCVSLLAFVRRLHSTTTYGELGNPSLLRPFPQSCALKNVNSTPAQDHSYDKFLLIAIMTHLVK